MSYNSRNNRGISSDDPQAVEKLKGKLTTLEDNQAFMKNLNAYYKKNSTCVGFDGLTDEKAAQLDATIQSYPSYKEKRPFQAYEITYGSQDIRRIKGRIAELEQSREVGFSGWEFEGGVAEVNDNINRLQLCFDERPTPEQCTVLKHHGFHWSPTNGAWQRQLNDNTIYAAGRIDFIKPKDGKTVREHQPKPPKKNEPER